MVKTLEKLIVTEDKVFDGTHHHVNVEPIGEPELLRRMHKEIDYNFVLENAPAGSDAYTQGDQIYITKATAYITAVQYWRKK